MNNKEHDFFTKIAMLLNFDINKKVKWSNIPKDLKEQVIFFLVSGTGFIVLNAIVAFRSIHSQSNVMFYTMLIGVLIGVGILIYGFFLYFKFIYQNYIVITGICTELSNSYTPLLKKQLLIYFKDARGITYQVSLNSNKSTYIRPGDKINIYLPDELSFFEKDGIYIIARFYSVKKEPISKQLNSINNTWKKDGSIV